MTTCPACGAAAFGGSVCTRCGYAAGEAQRCPHCGAVARAEPEVDAAGGIARWLCAMCGGPRIPGGGGGEAAANALRQAKVLLGGAARAKARSIAWMILAVVATLVVLAASAKAALASTLVLSLLAIVPAILAVRARADLAKKAAGAAEAQDRAWLSAAEEIVAAKASGITAEELGKALAISPTRADALLTKLAVHDRTRIDVGDDAEVRYSISPELEENGDDGDQAAPLAHERRRRSFDER